MRLRTLSAALLLASTLVAGSAHADLVSDRPSIRVARPQLQMVLVTALPARGVPAEDVARVEAAVRDHFAARRPQLAGCLGGADLREDPMRRRARRFELRVSFDRNGRPTRVWPHRDEGMPASARNCLLEAGRGVSVRGAPRGQVTVRVVYELR